MLKAPCRPPRGAQRYVKPGAAHLRDHGSPHACGHGVQLVRDERERVFVLAHTAWSRSCRLSRKAPAV